MKSPHGVWLLVQQPDEAADRCYLFTDMFARMLQLALASSTVFLLYVKRQIEFPKRPLSVWALDVGKQCIGSLFLHCASIITSVMFVNRDNHEDDDECAIYFVTFMLDVTWGVVLIVLLLRGIQALAERFSWEDLIDCGYYGDPPRLRVWWKQAAAYTAVMVIMKLLNTLLILALYPWIAGFATPMFRGFSHHRHLELTVVMVIVPGCCNAFQFWLLDSVIKTSAEHWRYKATSASADEKHWIQRSIAPPSQSPTASSATTARIAEEPTTTTPL